MPSHRLKPHKVLKIRTVAAALAKRAAPPAPAWPSYPGTGEFVGTSPSGRLTVYVDPTIGAPGVQNAHDLVAMGDSILAGNDQIFGTMGGSVQVIVFALGGSVDGTGGADHLACDFVTGGAIEVCAAFGEPYRCLALLEAEVSECSMGGNLCGFSNGEALSRWCASVLSSNALSDFATAPTWFQDGCPNFVDQTDPTDQNPDSTGCGMAFLSWLQSKGYALSAIAQAMVGLGDSGTLATLYGRLTGDSALSAWTLFMSAVQALPSGVTSDDPFGGATPAPAPGPAPAPAPGAGPTLAQAQAWASEGASRGLAENWPTS